MEEVKPRKLAGTKNSRYERQN